MYLRKTLAVLILILNLFLFYAFTKVVLDAAIEIFTKFNSENLNLNDYLNTLGKFFGSILFYLANTILLGISLRLFYKSEITNGLIRKINNIFHDVLRIQIILFGILISISIIFGIIDLFTESTISLIQFSIFSVVGIAILVILNWGKNRLFYIQGHPNE